jgi:hypothetical protein
MRPAKKGRIGTIMVTPPKLPANDSLPPLLRTAVMSTGLLAFAVVELKLSANARFQDRPGACKLIEAAVSHGDQTMARRLADCRAN